MLRVVTTLFAQHPPRQHSSLQSICRYKRNGNRVILLEAGNMIVRPLLLELSLVQKPFTHSVRNHMLDCYHKALHDVIVAQLNEDKRHQQGLEGMLQLLQDVPIVRLALQERAAQHFAEKLTKHMDVEERDRLESVREMFQNTGDDLTCPYVRQQQQVQRAMAAYVQEEAIENQDAGICSDDGSHSSSDRIRDDRPANASDPDRSTGGSVAEPLPIDVQQSQSGRNADEAAR